jgi:hypothetical protein
MKLTLSLGKRHGLEVWIISRDGVTVATFFSEAFARTRFAQLTK